MPAIGNVNQKKITTQALVGSAPALNLNHPFIKSWVAILGSDAAHFNAWYNKIPAAQRTAANIKKLLAAAIPGSTARPVDRAFLALRRLNDYLLKTPLGPNGVSAPFGQLAATYTNLKAFHTLVTKPLAANAPNVLTLSNQIAIERKARYLAILKSPDSIKAEINSNIAALQLNALNYGAGKKISTLSTDLLASYLLTAPQLEQGFLNSIGLTKASIDDLRQYCLIAYNPDITPADKAAALDFFKKRGLIGPQSELLSSSLVKGKFNVAAVGAKMASDIAASHVAATKLPKYAAGTKPEDNKPNPAFTSKMNEVTARAKVLTALTGRASAASNALGAAMEAHTAKSALQTANLALIRSLMQVALDTKTGSPRAAVSAKIDAITASINNLKNTQLPGINWDNAMFQKALSEAGFPAMMLALKTAFLSFVPQVPITPTQRASWAIAQAAADRGIDIILAANPTTAAEYEAARDEARTLLLNGIGNIEGVGNGEKQALTKFMNYGCLLGGMMILANGLTATSAQRTPAENAAFYLKNIAAFSQVVSSLAYDYLDPNGAGALLRRVFRNVLQKVRALQVVNRDIEMAILRIQRGAEFDNQLRYTNMFGPFNQRMTATELAFARQVTKAKLPFVAGGIADMASGISAIITAVNLGRQPGSKPAINLTIAAGAFQTLAGASEILSIVPAFAPFAGAIAAASMFLSTGLSFFASSASIRKPKVPPKIPRPWQPGGAKSTATTTP